MTFGRDGDSMALHAARLLHTGRVSDLAEAIRVAGGGARISRELINQHLQAMGEEAWGDAQLKVIRADILEVALELMDTIDGYLQRYTERFPDALETRLTGQAAQGRPDGFAPLYLRVLASMEPALLAQLLVDIGCSEPTFNLRDTSIGRLECLRTTLRGVEVRLICCPPGAPESRRSLNLFTQAPVALACAAEVEELLADLRGGD